MSPENIVVSPPLKDADVPAMTANSAHSPRGTDEALAVEKPDLRLVVVASVVAMLAINAIVNAKDLDAMLTSLVMADNWNEDVMMKRSHSSSQSGSFSDQRHTTLVSVDMKFVVATDRTAIGTP